MDHLEKRETREKQDLLHHHQNEVHQVCQDYQDKKETKDYRDLVECQG